MSGAFKFAVLVCVVYYVFSFSVYRVRCATNGEAGSDEAGRDNCCYPGPGGRRRLGGRFFQRLCSCFRPAASHVPRIRTSPRDITAAQLAIPVLSRLRNKYTPSCNFDQKASLPEDYTSFLESWARASPHGETKPYTILFPAGIHGTTCSLAHNYHVIEHPGCAIVQVSKKYTPGLNCATGRWLLEIYPTVSRETEVGVVTESVKRQLIPLLQRGLQYYGEPSATSLRSNLRVLLPAAVVERAEVIRHAEDPSLVLPGVALLRWNVVGSVKQFIDSLYEMDVIYSNVSTMTVLGGLLSLTHQLLHVVAHMHEAGFVVGNLTGDTFVVGDAGFVYVEGMMQLQQAMHPNMDPGYALQLHSPPEAASSGTRAYTVSTDAWQLGFVLLQLWCGGFRRSDESLWRMNRVEAFVTYHQVRAGLVQEIKFGGCLVRTPEFVKEIISGLLKREHRVTPSEILRTPQFSALVQAID